LSGDKVNKPDWKSPDGPPKLIGSSADRRERRRLIEETLSAYKRLHPAYLKSVVNYLEKITKVQTRKWKEHGGELKLQLPQDLFLTLRNIFRRCLPEGEPLFGDLEDDIALLEEIAPRIMPPIGGARARRGTRSR